LINSLGHSRVIKTWKKGSSRPRVQGTRNNARSRKGKKKGKCQKEVKGKRGFKGGVLIPERQTNTRGIVEEKWGKQGPSLNIRISWEVEIFSNRGKKSPGE